MNDRYLYRAKRKNWIDLPKDKWWVEGYYAFVDNHHYIYTGNLCNGGLYIVAERFEIDTDTLCACTGLKDKNGKLIWENDVALRTSSQGLFTGKIIYDKNGCLCHREFQTDFEALLIGSDRNIEVIGNIFDNPELMHE